MANKLYTELQNLANEELAEKLNAALSELTRLRFQHAVESNVSAQVLQHTKKEIARIKTEIRVRELAAFTPEMLAKRTKIVARRRKK